MNYFISLFAFCFMSFFQIHYTLAQDASTELEELYDRFDEEEDVKKSDRIKTTRKDKEDTQSLSDLTYLSPFSDIAVIQRKFLPRTQRFELSLSGLGSINNAFFLNIGLGLKGAYYFTTKWGVELTYLGLSSTERDVTSQLKERSVKTSSLVTPSSFYGAAVKWAPIYGKMSLLNDKVVPFDIYFTAGVGVSKTESDSPITAHIGTGQIFAWTKAMAFRWDFMINMYQPKVKSTSSASGFKTQFQNDIFISAGVSFFLPEAKYR